MSRKLCCLFLTLAVFISTVSIAYADSVSVASPTEEDYRQTVAVLDELGLQAGFESGRVSTQRLYSHGLPDGGAEATVTQLQFMALDEMETELAEQQAAREQLADNLALLAQYDGVMLDSTAAVYSDAGSTVTDSEIESGKVAKLKDVDASGRWYLVSFSDISGYVNADLCTPVSYADYENSDAVRTRAEIMARSNAAAARSFGTGVVSGGSTLRSAVVDYAYSFLGIPYSYGGASRSGTDCSGLTMQILGYYGIYVGHGCISQYYACQPISTSALEPGDLVFFYSNIGHVGIYVGGGQFIHAGDNGVCVASLYSSYWSNVIYGAGRIISD